MDARTDELEARLAAMAEAVRRLEGRVAALERGALSEPEERRPSAGVAAAVAEASAPPSEATPSSFLSLAGRTLLVLAGGFVLRALSDGGTLPVPVGAALAFVYAGVFVALADRAGGAGRPWSAAFHGLAAVLVAFPLLFEAVTRFRLLSPPLGTILLALLTAVALGVAAHRRLPLLAWAVGLAGMATSVALMAALGRLLVPGVYLVLLAVAALWLGYVRDWHGLRWPIAAAADLVLVAAALRAVAPDVVEGPHVAFALEALLLAAFLGSIAARTLGLGRGVVPFEIAQTAAALAVGLGGAIFVALRTGMGAGGFGAASILLGLAAYAVAFVFVERRQRARANFHFYATVGLLLLLVGTGLALPGAPRAIAWGALALVTSGLARWTGRRSLGVHGIAYAVAASFGSGLVLHAVRALDTPAGAEWEPLHVASALVLACVAASAWLAAGEGERKSRGEQVPLLVLDAILAFSAVGVVIGWLAPAVAARLGPDAGAGAVAAVRTGVLVIGVLGLAGAGRRAAWREAGWLAYPLLVAIALKILLEDVPRAHPAALLFSFALYGGALILVPRLRSKRAAPA